MSERLECVNNLINKFDKETDENKRNWIAWEFVYKHSDFLIEQAEKVDNLEDEVETLASAYDEKLKEIRNLKAQNVDLMNDVDNLSYR